MDDLRNLLFSHDYKGLEELHLLFRERRQFKSYQLCDVVVVVEVLLDDEETQLTIEVRILVSFPNLALHDLNLLLVFFCDVLVILLLVNADLKLYELSHVHFRRNLQLVDIGIILTLTLLFKLNEYSLKPIKYLVLFCHRLQQTFKRLSIVFLYLK